MDEEIEPLLSMPAIMEEFNIFEKTGKEEGLMVRLARLLKYGTWLDNKYLSNTMRELLGDITFQEAYNRSRRILNVTVSSASIHEMPRLLNYLTAPNVLIWSAVCASCSVPVMFASYDILAKNPKTGEHYSWNPSKFVDGSVDNDLPLSRLSEMFDVNHFIACQVNPHIVPFVKFSEMISSIEGDRRRALNWKRMWYNTQTHFADEVSHYLLMLSEIGLFKNVSTKFRAVLAQQYSGDITILPEILTSELGLMFKNPTKDYFVKSRLRAAQATWPKISLIRNHCAIELSLDKAIHELRSRLIPEWPGPVKGYKYPSARSQLALASEQRSTKHRLYHHRRRSDGMDMKYLIRRRSLQDIGIVRHPSVSPTLTRRKSNVSLFFSTPTPSRRPSVSVKKSDQIVV
jgi:TAG lipase/steryl ester hydrolase/phospholipase A2/LPA acyltransferase